MVSTYSTLVLTARPDCRKGSLATGQGTRYVFTPSFITVRQTIRGRDFYMAVACNVGGDVDIFGDRHCGRIARVAEWLVRPRIALSSGNCPFLRRRVDGW